MSGNPNPYHNIANWIFLGNNPLLPYQQEQKQPPPDEQKWMGMPIAPPPAPEEYKGQPEQKTDYVPPQMNVQLVPYGFNPFNNNGGGGGNIGGGGNRVPSSSRNLFGAKNGAMIFPMKGYPRNPRGLPYELQVENYRRGGMIVNRRMYGGANSEAERVFRSYENSHLRNHPNWIRFTNDYANNIMGNPNFTADNVREMALEYFYDVLGDDQKGDEKDEKEEKHTKVEQTTEDDNAPPTGGGDEEYEEWRRRPPMARHGRVIKRSNGGMTAEEAYYRYTGAPRIQPPPVWEPNGWGGGRYVFRSNGGLMTQDDLAQYYPYFDRNFSRLPNYQDFLDALNNLNAKRKLTERSLSKLIAKFFED